MSYPTLKSADTSTLERRSSISQHGGMLAVRKKGEWCPLVYDVIETVKCGRIYSHKSSVTDKHIIGYTFPVGNCKYISDLYLMHDVETTQTEVLPKWFGTGFYERRIQERDFVNADNGALGIHQEHQLRVGKDYVLAKTLLSADK